MRRPSERTVRAAGAACRVWEQGAGEPVALLAGVGGLPRPTRFLERLARTRRVITPSLPGFPGSEAIGRLDDHLDWLLATRDLLDAAGAGGADLIGVSVGAALAADVAAVWPASVRRLALVSPLGLFDAAEPTADLFAQRPGELAGLLCSDPAVWDAHVAAPEAGDPVEWAVVQARAQEAAARLLWPVGDTRLARRLHRVEQPALLVFGAADRVLPAGYRRLWRRALPHAALQVIDGAGHQADLDAPAALAAVIDRFLDQPSAAAAAGVGAASAGR